MRSRFWRWVLCLAARQLPEVVVTKREWLVVRSQAGSGGEIPRDVVERMGMDVSVVDRGGCFWFEREQSEAIHAHRDWKPTEESG